jgi:hypothetical protein
MYTFKGQDDIAVFLAGGISNCPPWQDVAVDYLLQRCSDDLVILNPRRKNFDITQKDIQRQQIEWEWQHLEWADKIIFWFPNETLCPITLFEYGKWVKCNHVYVGCDPYYQKREDVIIQTELERPQATVHQDLTTVLDEFINDLGF